GLFTAEFYSHCQRSLKNNGLVITQGESPMFHSDTFVELNKCLKGIFGKSHVHTLLFHATTYPSGMWSLQIGVKGHANPAVDFNKDKARQFSLDKGLRYYNEEVH